MPDEEEQFALYKDLLQRLSPFPVTVRTLDAGGEKLKIEGFSDREANPALGLRAVRFSLKRPDIFQTQLRALLRASVFGRLRIMFPMITSVCEVDRLNSIVEQVKEDLRMEGLRFDEHCEIGIMIEVPSAVSVSDVLAQKVDFFSIGTNDLIQYALAIDRGNEHVAHLYEPLHPAVLRMIRQVVEAGHASGIEVGLCGEMASDIRLFLLLMGLGIDELSMYPQAIPYVKRMLRNSRMEEAEKLVDVVLNCPSAQAVYDVLGEYLPERYPDEFGEDGIWQVKKTCCSVNPEE